MRFASANSLAVGSAPVFGLRRMLFEIKHQRPRRVQCIALFALIAVYFSAAPALDALDLVLRDTEGEEEFLVAFRGAALELGVPAAAGILIHSRGIEHLDPK